jgi:hypothetical protein
MAFKHGKNTVVKVGADDLSEFTNSTAFNRSGDALDVTTYGKNSKVFIGGLKDCKITIEGNYDSGVGGPSAIIEPLLATETTFTFQPEGTGTGKPQKVVDVVVTAFNVSSPVADQIKWTCEMQGSDDVDDSAQV